MSTTKVLFTVAAAGVALASAQMICYPIEFVYPEDEEGNEATVYQDNEGDVESYYDTEDDDNTFSTLQFKGKGGFGKGGFGKGGFAKGGFGKGGFAKGGFAKGGFKGQVPVQQQAYVAPVQQQAAFAQAPQAQLQAQDQLAQTFQFKGKGGFGKGGFAKGGFAKGGFGKGGFGKGGFAKGGFKGQVPVQQQAYVAPIQQQQSVAQVQAQAQAQGQF